MHKKHLLLWEPRRILSNSAPKIWSSVIWLNGVESSKGFQSAISADSDLPPAVPAFDNSPCSKETDRRLPKIQTSHRQNVCARKNSKTYDIHVNFVITSKIIITSTHVSQQILWQYGHWLSEVHVRKTIRIRDNIEDFTNRNFWQVQILQQNLLFQVNTLWKTLLI